MTENVSRRRDDLVACLRRAGELQVSGDNQAELDSSFDTRQFRFHGPDGFETDYGGLANYFKAIRAAFDDRSIRRGIVVAEANTSPARRGSRGHLSVSSHSRRRVS
jgi:hypothetical protein